MTRVASLPVLALLCAVAFAQTLTPDVSLAAAAIDRAHLLHQRLDRVPIPERHAGDYEDIVNVLSTVWRGDVKNRDSEAALFDAASVYIAEARELHDESAYKRAATLLENLLRDHPYTAYRRNADWALAQIDWFHCGDRPGAQHWLKDFVSRYPADTRVPLANRQLQGEDITEPALLPQAPTAGTAAKLERSNSQAPATPQKVAAFQEVRTEHPPLIHMSRNDTAGAGSAACFAGAGQPPCPTAIRLPLTAESLGSNAPASTSATLPGKTTASEQAGTQTSPTAHEDQTEERPLRQVAGISFDTLPDRTDISLALNAPTAVDVGSVPELKLIYVDLKDTRLVRRLRGTSIPVRDTRVRRIRLGENRPGVARIVIEGSSDTPRAVSTAWLDNPHRLVITVENSNAPTAVEQARNALAQLNSAPDAQKPRELVHATEAPRLARRTPAKSAVAIASSVERANLDELDRRTSAFALLSQPPPLLLPKIDVTPAPSLTRTLGLKIRKVVIDAGHGGHDTGTIGPGGLQEKDVVLDVALRLGHLLAQQLGADVIYTRHDDTFIPLRERTAIANREQADLFVSIHANSSGDPDAAGVETYYLNLPHSAHEMAVAHRENATGDYSEHDLQTMVEKIALSDKLQESRVLARTLQRSISRVTDEDSRGVKRAPFVVLIGAQMPSVLAEIAFLSNEPEGRKLSNPAYRQRIARGLYAGIAAYIRSINGFDAGARFAGPLRTSPHSHGSSPAAVASKHS